MKYAELSLVKEIKHTQIQWVVGKSTVENYN